MINLAQKLFKGATSNANGEPGIVPAPLIADKDKYFKGDGTWDTPSGGGSSTLAGLSDVDITSPSDGQILQYDATSQKWINESGTVIPSKTVTVYSAASDTLTYSDLTGTKTVTTDANGEGTANIVCVDGASITFTSSVAKDPSNLSQDFSKTFTITTSTTAVYVMPNDNVLYWHGYKSNEYEVMATANGWSGTYHSVTDNTNYIRASVSGPGFSGISYKSKHSATSIKTLMQGVIISGTYYGGYGAFSTKNPEETGRHFYYDVNVTSIALYTKDVSTFGEQYFSAFTFNNRECNIYALWYE